MTISNEPNTWNELKVSINCHCDNARNNMKKFYSHTYTTQTCTLLFNVLTASTEESVPVSNQCIQAYSEEIHIKCMEQDDYSCSKELIERPEKLNL
jgi:hypothetical protein